MSEAVMPAGWPAMSIQQAHALLGQPGLPTEVAEETIRGVTVKVWKNQPPTLRAVAEMAKGFGERVFLVYEDERVTYEAFHRAVAARDEHAIKFTEACLKEHALTGDAANTDPACSLSPMHEEWAKVADVESHQPSPAFVYRRPGGATTKPSVEEKLEPSDA